MSALKNYPESIAKTPNKPGFTKIIIPESAPKNAFPDQQDFNAKFPDHYQFKPEIGPDHNSPCSPGFLTGYSATNKFHKLVFCGKEWCKCCGSYLSPTHVRRITRVWPRVFRGLQGTVNYFVITIPMNLRVYMNKEGLNKFRKYWIQKIKREFPGARGFSRFHWAGDENPTTYSPHLNILFSGPGWIEPEILERFRREFSGWLKTTFKLSDYPPANIFTRYTDNVNKKKHLVNYITRATFFGNSQYIQEIIKGFRNTAPFGKFEKAELEAVDELTNAMRNIDSTDGSKIIWETQTKVVEKEKVDFETGEISKEIHTFKRVILRPQKSFENLVLKAGAEHIGGGIFRMKKVQEQPEPAPPENLI